MRSYSKPRSGLPYLRITMSRLLAHIHSYAVNDKTSIDARSLLTTELARTHAKDRSQHASRGLCCFACYAITNFHFKASKSSTSSSSRLVASIRLLFSCHTGIFRLQESSFRTCPPTLCDPVSIPSKRTSKKPLDLNLPTLPSGRVLYLLFG
jgi:hypothetical protein